MSYSDLADALLFVWKFFFFLVLRFSVAMLGQMQVFLRLALSRQRTTDAKTDLQLSV